MEKGVDRRLGDIDAPEAGLGQDSYGIAYEDIDNFLEGKPVNQHVCTTIYRFCDATRQKRSLAVTLYD